VRTRTAWARWTRLTPVRGELLERASALEQTQTPDPASVTLLRELSTNAALYSPHLPADDLHATLAQARAGITTQTTV
jgi:hypothetical protein